MRSIASCWRSLRVGSVKPTLWILRGVAGAATLLLVACGPAQKKTSETTTNTTAGENPLTAPVDYLGAAAQAQKSAVRTVDLVSVRQAGQLFQVSEGRYPANLEELVAEQYLPRIPALPAGLRYAYDPRSGQVEAVAQ